jgi:putative endonuclease
MRYWGRTYYVYILASERDGVLYIGFTGNLARRMYEHRHEVNEGFTKRYHVKKLVYYEAFGDPMSGIRREKQLKKWNRAWKIQLIEKYNCDWKDLYQKESIMPLPKEWDGWASRER